MGRARLGDWRFTVDPNSIEWGIKANLYDAKGLGGKVVQVLSVHYTELTVKVAFTTWEEQWDFVLFMKSAIREDLAEDSPEHMRFLYPPRDIDFTVAVMGIKQASRSVKWTPGTPVQPANLSMQIIGDAKGITTRMPHDMIDDYINRFSEDFGWKRTPYNGPISAEAATAYAAGINQREPLTGADRVLVERGLSTPSIAPGTVPGNLQ